MILRKRSQNSTDSVKPEKVVKKKSGIVRRSERIKTDEKSGENDPNRATKKEKRTKKKGKRKRTTDNDDSDESDEEAFFPAVVETGAKDVLQQIGSIRTEEQPILKEAGVIFECRKCKSFFRVFSTFIKHKQCFCPNTLDVPANHWNPYLSKEMFDLLPSSDEGEDSDGNDGSNEDSAFEDGHLSSTRDSDAD